MNENPTTWLVSLHRYYAEWILDGKVKYEFRKNRMGCKTGDRILLYATKPDGVILGEFTVGEGSYMGADPEMIENVCDPDGELGLSGFFAHAKTATALRVKDAIRYDTPQGLEKMTGLTRGPMSYRRAEVINDPLNDTGKL